MRLKALAEIYTMHSFAPFSKLTLLFKIRLKCAEICKMLFKKSAKISAIFNENCEIRERCKGVHCVDLDESFPTSIYLQNFASIQPRRSPPKFAQASKRYPSPVINLALDERSLSEATVHDSFDCAPS